MISKINIRATSFEEFWGHKYDSDIYLWEGAKRNLTLDEIEAISCETMPDKFASFEAIDDAMIVCKDAYFKYASILANVLNRYHQVKLSDESWRIAFGYWLYRHVCTTYEKYIYLSNININEASIVILDKESYFIPKDSVEHFELFGQDFGVQQLISQYYYMFAPKKFETLNKSFKGKITGITGRKNRKRELSIKVPGSIKSTIKKLLSPKVALLDTYYSSKHIKKLIIRTRGKFMPVNLPEININERNWDIKTRESIFNIETSNQFEQYLTGSFVHGLPTIFLEDFKKHYSLYVADIKKAGFQKIVSEGWMGISNVALYCAVAQEMGKQLIFHEHASSCSLVERSFKWFYLSFKNLFITTGWKSYQKNVASGGFMAKSPEQYKYIGQNQVLYISQATAPYLMEFSWIPSNSNFLNTLKVTRELIELLPENILREFKYRPRPSNKVWNTALTLGLKNNPGIIDSGAFHDSIYQSKIIIIDHLSTSITELLQIKVPFLLLINPHTEITQEAKPVFIKLEEVGVVHYTPDTLVSKLIEVNSNVRDWWSRNDIQDAIDEFKSVYINNPDKTFEILDSLLTDEPSKK